jgi:Zn-dependent protease with chaperone function
MIATSPLKHAAVVALILLAIPAWSVSPATPQLPDPGTPGMSRADQEKLGLQAMAEVYKQMPVLPDSSPITQYVQRLGRKLQKQIPPERSWPYQFHVVEQKDINAFALPGGPIFINVGTINAAATEAQLAGVMSHEMSHVYMQHSAKQATSTKRTIAEILGAAGGILGGSTLGSLARVGIQFGAGTLLMKYSRQDEAQADSVGGIIMYKAGYDPMELAHFFEALAKEGGGGPQFLSDHPNPGNRSEAIAKEIRDWPPRSYLGDSRRFVGVKKQASAVHAYSAQEISDGAKQGLWARQNVGSGAVPASAQESVSANANSATLSEVSLDQIRPTGEFTEVHQNGLSISYPANWSIASAQNSLTIAPKAAVSQNAIAYGVVINGFDDSNASYLDQVTHDLIENLVKTNPGMRQAGEIRGSDVNGVQGRTADLTGNSPIQQGGTPIPEHDWLVVVPRSRGSYLSLIFIAPEKDFAALRPTYQRMLDSLRVE